MHSNYRVAVTGVHIASAPKSGAAVIKELAHHPDITAVALADYSQNCALGWEDYVQSVFSVPQAVLGSAPLAERILDIHSAIGIDCLIPCDDEDVGAVAETQDMLAAGGISLLLSETNAIHSVAKENIHSTLSHVNVASPRQTVIADETALEHVAVDRPVVVKGRLIQAYFARDTSEAKAFATRLADIWGFPIILQEWVDGAEYTVTAVADRDNEIRGICALRKMGISSQGKTWMAVTIDAAPWECIVSSIVRGLGWVGPLEVEFICDPSGHNPTVIEVNPRFPAWIAVSRHAGADLVRLVVDLALGKSPDRKLSARPGVCFVRTYETTSFPIENMASLFSRGEVTFTHSN
ncbi:MAG TPA: ATP-grasp domain-containing protein [Thermoguttaceae bacterium]|nr:ATP-grasp domain-containing protein [Thermoguttaceae bacterium]